MNIVETSHSFIPPKRRTVLGLRRSALAEIAIALAVLLALDLLWLGSNRYWAANPHPFWFVVLFVAGKYGTREGLVAALACSAALLIGNLPEQQIGQDSYAYAMTVLKLPLLWLISAVAFGELRQMHIRERDRLEKAVQDAETREQSIAQSYQWVKDLKDQLELRMAGQLRSSLSVYRAARAMETLRPLEVLKGIEELVGSSLYPEQFSIYGLSGNGLDATLMHGWKEEDSHLRHFGTGSALYEAIVGRQEILCVANANHEQLLSGQGILAGPLIDRASGEVVGMLKIEKMRFSDLHLSSIEAFGAICEWAGMAIVNARRYQQAKEGSIVNPDHHLLTGSYFRRHTDYLTSLAQRMGFDVSMIGVRLINLDQFDEATRTRMARALSDAVDSVLRNIDLAFDTQETREEYAIVLPATGRSGADIVLTKIRAALAERIAHIDRHAEFTCSVQTVYEKRAA